MCCVKCAVFTNGGSRGASMHRRFVLLRHCSRMRYSFGLCWKLLGLPHKLHECIMVHATTSTNGYLETADGWGWAYEGCALCIEPQPVFCVTLPHRIHQDFKVSNLYSIASISPLLLKTNNVAPTPFKCFLASTFMDFNWANRVQLR